MLASSARNVPAALAIRDLTVPIGMPRRPAEKEGKDKEKEHKDKDKDSDKLTRQEKLTAIERFAPPQSASQPVAPQDAAAATQRTFIQPQDRPPVGEKALQQSAGEEATQASQGGAPAAEAGAEETEGAGTEKAPPRPRRKRAPRKPAGPDS